MLQPLLRSLTRSPGFTAFVIVTLALGIGANTAVFTVADAFLFKPVPFPEADRLVMLHQRAPGNTTFPSPVTPADFLEFRKQSAAFGQIAAYQPVDFNLAERGAPEPVYSALVTANFFDTLGMQPMLGHTFAPADEEPGKRVAVLSYGLWQRHFGGDPDVVGREVRLNSHPYTVIGVMRRDFRFPIAVALWTPLVLNPKDAADHATHSLRVVARLKPGVPETSARAELESIAARLAEAYPQTNHGWGAMVQPLRRYITGDLNRQYTFLLLGAVFFVLLIACANVMNLQFAHLSGRHKEFAVRAALGAGRWRMVRQITGESTVLALAGALASLPLSSWCLSLLLASMPQNVARFIAGWENIQLDGRALAFTVAIAVFAGIASGLVPAFRNRVDINEALKESGRGSSAGIGRQRLRSILVAAEIAAATVLLIGAGLLVKGSRLLLDVNAGLHPESILTMQIALTDQHYGQAHQRASFYDRMLERVAEQPGVASATLVSNVPYGNNETMARCAIEGQPAHNASEQRMVQVQVVSPNYLEMAGIPLLQGRGFRDSDALAALPVAIVTAKFASRYWPGQNPLGRRIRTDGEGGEGPWLTVVGVAQDTRYNPWATEIAPAVYRPYRQAPLYYTYIAIRAKAGPLALSTPVRSAIAALDMDQPLFEIEPLDRVITDKLIGLSYVAVMLSILGAIAVVLSAAGIYGLMAYSVTERTHEIGIRVALGASRPDLLRMLAGHGFFLTLCGLAAGLAISLPLARLLASLIYGVGANDLATFAGAAGLLGLVALVACYVPARRAMSVDPVVALRRE